MKKPRTKPKKINYQHLKPKRRKVGYRHVRSTNHSCPNCLSSIKINNEGQWYCTGDRLELWSKDFEEYSKMHPTDKQAYLKTLDNPEKFLEWYANKKDPSCGWTSKLPRVDQTFTQRIPDPMAVGKIEKSLGRSLTEEELEDGFTFYRRLTGSKFEYALGTDLVNVSSGWNLYVIPRVNFPEEV